MAVIVVVGASRGVGLETVRAALAASHDVRALARSADRIPIADERLQKIQGNATDVPTLRGAVTGADAVIQTLGRAATLDMPFTGTTIFSAGTRALVDAMTAEGVRRLVAVTGLGAGDSRGRGGLLYDALLFPVLLRRTYDDKDVQERMIRNSALEWTIVRPGLLQDGPATGHARAIVDPAGWVAAPVRRADVAAFLVEEAMARRYVGQTPLLIA